MQMVLGEGSEYGGFEGGHQKRQMPSQRLRMEMRVSGEEVIMGDEDGLGGERCGFDATRRSSRMNFCEDVLVL